MSILMKKSWGWFAILSIIIILFTSGTITEVHNQSTEYAKKTLGNSPLMSFIIYSLHVLLPIIAFIVIPLIIATTWHQQLILNTTLDSPKRFGLNEYTRNYIAKAITIWVISAAPLLFIVLANLLLLIGPSPLQQMSFLESLTSTNLAYYLTTFFWIFILSRFGLILPAAAVGEKLSLDQSYRLTSGEAVKILFVLTLTTLPILVLEELGREVLQITSKSSPSFENKTPLFPGQIIHITTTLIYYLSNMLLALLPLSALSHIYMALKATNAPTPGASTQSFS